MWGLPVLNGKVACVVVEKHDIYRAGGKHGFTPAAITEELRKRSPRFRPDTELGSEADDLTRIPGLTAADQQLLNDRGVTHLDHLAHETGHGQAVRNGVSAWFALGDDERRKRRLIRDFREAVAQSVSGIDGALKSVTAKAKASTKAKASAKAAKLKAKADNGRRKAPAKK
jgi:hypothetical protein